MAAKKRRITPSLDQLTPSRGVTGGTTPSYGLGGQLSGYDERASGMQGLAASLGSLNPALRNFSRGRDISGMAQSPEHYDKMLEGVQGNAVAFKKILKESGHSQWYNPHVYRTEIINIAESTAVRDVQALAGNKDLTDQLTTLSKKAPDSFYDDALELLKDPAYKPKEYDVEKGAGGFWDTGYAHGYIKGRDKLLEQYAGAAQLYKQRKVMTAFHDNGRQKLRSFLDTKPKIDGKLNPDYDANFKEFRTFISQQYASTPETRKPYMQTVFDSIVMPMFIEMASEPDSDGRRQKQWNKIMTMTRSVIGKDGKPTGSRTALFDKFGDLSSAEGVQMMANQWSKIQDKEDNYFKQQGERQRLRTANLAGMVMPVIKYWDSWSQENKEYLLDRNVDSNLDPYDEQNWVAIGQALADHPEFSWAAEESQHATNRIFLQALDSAQDIINSTTATGLKAEKEAKKELIEKFASEAMANPMGGIAAVKQQVMSAIGNPNYSLAEAKAAVTELVNPDYMAAEFFTKNPNITPNQFPVIQAYGQWVTNFVSQNSMAAGQLISVSANQLLSNPDTSREDLSAMIKMVRDAQVEINDVQLDKELGALESALDKRIKVGPYFKQSPEKIKDMVTEGLLFGDTPEQISEILGFKDSIPSAAKSGVASNVNKVTSDEAMAAQAAFMELQRQARMIYAEEVENELTRAGNQEDVDKYMQEKGIQEAEARTVKRIALLKRSVINSYRQNLNQSESGRAKNTAVQKSMMNEADATTLNEYRQLEGIFVESNFGAGGKTVEELAGEPRTALQFTTGRAGQQRWEALAVNRIAREERKETLRNNRRVYKKCFARQNLLQDS